MEFNRIQNKIFFKKIKNNQIKPYASIISLDNSCFLLRKYSLERTLREFFSLGNGMVTGTPQVRKNYCI